MYFTIIFCIIVCVLFIFVNIDASGSDDKYYRVLFSIYLLNNTSIHRHITTCIYTNR